MPIFHPSIFRYEQNTPATDWVIQHNLGNNGSTGVPMVDVYMMLDGSLQKVSPEIVTMNDKNSVTVTFKQPQTGFAVVIV